MRYNQALHIFQIMMNAPRALLQPWGTVKYNIRLYNLAQDNVSLVKFVLLESV